MRPVKDMREPLADRSINASTFKSVCHTSKDTRKGKRHQRSGHDLAWLALAYILGDAGGHYVKERLCRRYDPVIPWSMVDGWG